MNSQDDAGAVPGSGMGAQSPGSRRAPRFLVEIPLLVLAQVLVASFHWNRSLGLSLSGWFEYAAAQINNGAVPYRDFYLFSPPLFPDTLAVWFRIFGTSIEASYAFGVVTRIVTVTLLYVFMRRLAVPVVLAFVTSTATLLLFIGDTADPVNYYNHFTMMFVMAGGLLLAVSFERNSRWLGFAGGIAAVLAVLSKQTIGSLWLAFVVVLPVLWWLLRRASGQRGRALGPAPVLGIYSGVVLTGAVAVIGLWVQGALTDFFDQVYISGPAAKGGLLTSLLRSLSVLGTPALRYALVLAALLMIAACAWAVLAQGSRRPDRWPIWSSSVAGAVLIVLLAAIGFRSPEGLAARVWNYAVIYGGFAAALLGVLALVWITWRRRDLPEAGNPDLRASVSVLLLAGMSAAAVVGLSLSFPVYEPMALPTAAALVMVPVVLMSWREQQVTDRSAVPLTASMALAVIVFASWKAWNPFGWEHWIEPPISQSSQQVSSERLGDLRLSPETAETVAGVNALIQENSRSENDVFVYPSLPLFYFLNDKQAPTFAPVHFPDVMIDKIQQADLQRIKDDPPRVIVTLPLSPEEVTGFNKTFRGGQDSALNPMNEYLTSLEPEYRLVGEFPTRDGRFIRVYVLKGG